MSSFFSSAFLRSAWVGFTSPSVCLSVCLFVCLSVCPQHNSEANDHKVFKLGTGNDLGYTRSHMLSGLKGQRSKVTKSIIPFCILQLRFIDIR